MLRRLPLSILVSILLIAAVAGEHALQASSPASRNKEGNRLYADGKYQDAEKAYVEAQAKAPGKPELLYNMGNALLKQKKYQEALQALRQAVSRGNRGLQGNGWYNLGNALYEMGNFNDSANAFIQSLRVNPADRDAKQNLELALRKMQEQKKSAAGGGGKDGQKQNQQKPQDQSAANGSKEQDGKKDESAGSQPQDQDRREQPGNPQTTQAGKRETGLNKDRALQILEALQNQELAEQRKLLERQQRRKATGKDW